MAERGKRLDSETRARIVRLARSTPIRRTARLVGVSKNTAKKYIRQGIEV